MQQSASHMHPDHAAAAAAADQHDRPITAGEQQQLQQQREPEPEPKHLACPTSCPPGGWSAWWLLPLAAAAVCYNNWSIKRASQRAYQQGGQDFDRRGCMALYGEERPLPTP